MKYFFDSHMHAMNLDHPDFVSTISSLNSGIADLLTSGFFSTSYILEGTKANTTALNNKLINLLLAFEKPIGETFAMMEDDLKGLFKNKLSEKEQENFVPYIYNSKLKFRNTEYDKFALIPLLMDFSNNNKDFSDIYYPISREIKILKYVEDSLQAFKDYKKYNKDGILEFFPFLGINTPAHSLEFIKDLTSTYINKTHTINKRVSSKKKFYGIKFYPPLGLNPWPTDKKELDKMLYIYQFCCENDLPIITHCDDQGFRTIPTKEAWAYTNPKSWDVVLQEFPNLKIDFAHSGKQYSSISNIPTASIIAQNLIKPKSERLPTSPWFYNIIDLMKKYKNVYLDFSFSGSSPQFYCEFINFLNLKENENIREHVITHSLFGSDFSVNLFKVKSYSQYFNIFENSSFNDKEIELFASQNPIDFLNLKI
ncbi:MAG: amidohydrolase family protein [Sphaerochaetaceae bacterium]|nr:amidohydrolase family protein [Sphaerochaetaceae bacterium]